MIFKGFRGASLLTKGLASSAPECSGLSPSPALQGPVQGTAHFERFCALKACALLPLATRGMRAATEPQGHPAELPPWSHPGVPPELVCRVNTLLGVRVQDDQKFHFRPTLYGSQGTNLLTRRLPAVQE